MATLNPFDLLGDDDTEDPTQLIAKLAPVIAAAKTTPPAVGKKGSAPPLKEPAPVKLPSKPLPPSQAVREARGDAPRGGRGGFRGGSRGRGGGRGFNREFNENENSFGNSNGNTGGYRGSQEGEAGKTLDRHGSGPRDGFRGGRRGGFNNGDSAEGDGFRGVRRGGFNNGEAAAEGERPRRTYERRSGTGRENNFKREGAGRGNWGTPTDEIPPEANEPVADVEKVVDSEKPTGQEETEVAEKDVNVKEPEVKEPEEDKEMTLEEYEKVIEEKRKALLALKPEERKVNLDKEFESMQLLGNKKNDEDVSAKGSEKDKRKDAMEKAKKSLSINEFLKPAEGDAYYRPGGRGRGRGQGRGGGNHFTNVKAPSIEDVSQFPSLGGK